VADSVGDYILQRALTHRAPTAIIVPSGESEVVQVADDRVAL
jgi:hypothetical protein